MIDTLQTGARIAAFDDCCKEIHVYEDADNPGNYTWRGSRCHDRLCLPCAELRSRTIRNALMKQIGGKPHKFITLTLSGKDQELTELIDRLYRHFRALRQHPTWADSVRGGAAFLEIKWNEKVKRWHPHLHIVADADYIAQGELSDAWRSITKDSYIVDIRLIRDENTAAAYVTKYASKPLNMTFGRDHERLMQAILALKGRRLCLTFGSWYGTPLTNAEDDELEEIPWTKDPYRMIRIGTAADLFRRARTGEVLASRILHDLGLRMSKDATAPP